VIRLERTESWPDGDWVVRPVPGATALKAYRCPGCDQEIRPGTPHLVTWPVDGSVLGQGLGERRHWHRACWERRMHRHLRRPRGRRGTGKGP
jgi:hypothetical protein